MHICPTAWPGSCQSLRVGRYLVWWPRVLRSVMTTILYASTSLPNTHLELIVSIVSIHYDPESAISDTNDYTSFPDFEAQFHSGGSQSLCFRELIATFHGGPYV